MEWHDLMSWIAFYYVLNSQFQKHTISVPQKKIQHPAITVTTNYQPLPSIAKGNDGN